MAQTTKITENHITHQREGVEDSVDHFIKSGHKGDNGKPLWYFFQESAYDVEGVTEQMVLMRQEDVEEIIGQTIDDKLNPPLIARGTLASFSGDVANIPKGWKLHPSQVTDFSQHPVISGAPVVRVFMIEYTGEE